MQAKESSSGRRTQGAAAGGTDAGKACAGRRRRLPAALMLIGFLLLTAVFLVAAPRAQAGSRAIVATEDSPPDIYVWDLAGSSDLSLYTAPEYPYWASTDPLTVSLFAGDDNSGYALHYSVDSGPEQTLSDTSLETYSGVYPAFADRLKYNDVQITGGGDHTISCWVTDSSNQASVSYDIRVYIDLSVGGVDLDPVTIGTLAGSTGDPGLTDGVGGGARFFEPSGVACAPDGTIYVADSWNYSIRKVTPFGAVTTLAGTAGERGATDGAGAEARFTNPVSVAVDPVTGAIYVADAHNANTIRKITPAGVVTTFAGQHGVAGSADGPGTAASFNYPTSVACDPSGNVFVADANNNTIRKITPAGVVSTYAGAAGVAGFTDGPAAAARFNAPRAVACDAAGNVYVGDVNSSTIRKIGTDGVVTTLAGRPSARGYYDGTGSAARFYAPQGLACDAAGNVYVVDRWTCTLRRVSPAGVVQTLAGSGDAGYGADDGTGDAARFNSPSGVAVNAAGVIYVVDAENQTIRTSGAVPDTHTWDGEAGDGLWSSATNWAGDSLPSDGDSLVFPANVAGPPALTNDLLAEVGDVTIGGNADPYSFVGDPLTLSGDLSLSSDAIGVVWGIETTASDGSQVIATPKADESGPPLVSSSAMHAQTSGQLVTSGAAQAATSRQLVISGAMHTATNKQLEVYGLGDVTFTGGIDGSGGLTVLHPENHGQEVRLDGTNTYTGPTQLGVVDGGSSTGGYLRVLSAGGLPAGTAVAIGSDATLHYDVANSDRYVTWNNTITCSGSTATAGFMVDSGMLELGGTYPGPVPSVIAVADGATLRVSGDMNTEVRYRGTLYGTGTVQFLTWDTTDGAFTAHASPGSAAYDVGLLTASRDIVWRNGTYDVDLADAAGAAGVGYDSTTALGDFYVQDEGYGKFRVDLRTASGGAAGACANFDPTQTYRWHVARIVGNRTGSLSEAATLDTSTFQNDTAGGRFSLDWGTLEGDTTVDVVFTPVTQSIVVTAPHGGGSYLTGSQLPVAWTSAPLVTSGEFSVWLVSRGNVKYGGKIVAAHGASAHYTDSLTVNAPKGAGYRICVYYRATRRAPWSVYGTGDGAFTVTDLPDIVVTAPSGSGSYARGSPLPVAWTSVPLVKSGEFSVWVVSRGNVKYGGKIVAAHGASAGYKGSLKVNAPRGTGYRICVYYRATRRDSWTTYGLSAGTFSVK